MPTTGEADATIVQAVAPQSTQTGPPTNQNPSVGGDNNNDGTTAVSVDVSKLSLNPLRSKSTTTGGILAGGGGGDGGGAAILNGINNGRGLSPPPPSTQSSHGYGGGNPSAVEASQALKGLQQTAIASTPAAKAGVVPTNNTNNEPATITVKQPMTTTTGTSTTIRNGGNGSSAPTTTAGTDPSSLGGTPGGKQPAGLRIKATGGNSAPAHSSAAAPTAVVAAPAGSSSKQQQPPVVVRGTTEKEASDELEEDAEEGEDGEEESSEISASDEDGSWISWFCSLRGNEFFCEVDEDYIQDDFNLTGLNGLVPYYDYALDMVLDVEMPMEDSLTEAQQEIVESAAEMLYGLIHARYIVTNRGMHAMYEKYRSAAFGRCPHVFCQGQPVLPVGLSDLPRNYTVNVFCPRCHGLFFPKSTRQANIDGAYFGTTFPHLYLMTHPDMVPNKPTQQYQPRIYGFKINQASLYYRNHEEASSSRHSSGRERSSRKKNRQLSGAR